MTQCPISHTLLCVQSCAEESDASAASGEAEPQYTEEEWQQRISTTRMRLLNTKKAAQSHEAQLIIGKTKVEANDTNLQHLQQELLVTGRTNVSWKEIQP